VKQAVCAYVNHARIRSWNQPVLRNEGKVSCSSKQLEPLMGFELTTDMHPPIASAPMCTATSDHDQTEIASNTDQMPRWGIRYTMYIFANRLDY